MKPILKLSLLSFLVLFCLIGCQAPIDTKEKYLKEYETFVEDIKKHKDDYSEKEWEKKDEEFKRFSDELYSKYSEELGIIEQAQIAKYALIYGSTRGVKALHKALEGDELEKSVEEFKELWDNELKDDLEEVFTEVKKVWDEDLKDELQDKLDEIKETLQDEEFQEKVSSKLEEVKDILEDEKVQDDFEDVMKKLGQFLESIEKELNDKKEK